MKVGTATTLSCVDGILIMTKHCLHTPNAVFVHTDNVIASNVGNYFGHTFTQVSTVISKIIPLTRYISVDVFWGEEFLRRQ